MKNTTITFVFALLFCSVSLNGAGLIGKDYLAVSARYADYNSDILKDAKGVTLNYNYAFKNVNLDLLALASISKVGLNYGYADMDTKNMLVGARYYVDLSDNALIFGEIDYIHQKTDFLGQSIKSDIAQLSIGAAFQVSGNFAFTPYVASNRDIDGGEWLSSAGFFCDYDFTSKIGAVAQVSMDEDSDFAIQIGCKLTL